MTEERKGLLDNIVVKYGTHLVKYPYFIIFEIRELDWQSKRPGK